MGYIRKPLLRDDLLVDLQEVEAGGLAAARFGGFQAAERAVRRAEVLEAVAPVDQARFHRRTQAARARVAVAGHFPVAAVLALEPVVAGLAEQDVAAVAAIDRVGVVV